MLQTFCVEQNGFNLMNETGTETYYDDERTAKGLEFWKSPVSYTHLDVYKRQQDDSWSVLPPFRGCACVKSTASDISRYYKMLSDGGVWEGCQVIPAEAVDLLIGRSFPTEERPYYCLGLEKRLIAGKIVCDHSGGLHGVSTKGGFIEGGYGIAVLCNEGEDVYKRQFFSCFS